MHSKPRIQGIWMQGLGGGIGIVVVILVIGQQYEEKKSISAPPLTVKTYYTSLEPSADLAHMKRLHFRPSIRTNQPMPHYDQASRYTSHIATDKPTTNH